MTDNDYMQRCLDLASAGLGFVAPNPLVGAVIVCNDRIIGEGAHRFFGKEHAEVNAIRSVTDKELLKRSTLYVSLEPCNHTGKTPPCTDLILQSGIPSVVIGMKDPNALVNGSGIKRLQDAGLNVATGCLENQCRELNRRFITYHSSRRPYIILKWAESLDGFTGKKGMNITLSNELSAILTHKWRSEEQAVMVGSNTVITDNPQLNVRHWYGNDPLIVSIDKEKKFDRKLNIFKRKGVIFTFKDSELINGCQYVQLNSEMNIIQQMLDYLYSQNIQSVFVEGGAALHQAFLQEGLWDEARIFKTPAVLVSGIRAPSVTGRCSLSDLGNNELQTWYNQ